MPRADIDGFRLPVVLLSALIALAMATPAYAFLDFLFAPSWAPSAAEDHDRPTGEVHDRPRRRITVTPRFNASPRSTSGPAGKMVCVRLCDGYYFPLSAQTSDKKEAEAACQMGCPGASAKVFTRRGEDIDDAFANDKSIYKQLANAKAFQKSASASCGCFNNTTAERGPVFDDPTMRQGDFIIVDGKAMTLKPGAREPYDQSDYIEVNHSRHVHGSVRNLLRAKLTVAPVVARNEADTRAKRKSAPLDLAPSAYQVTAGAELNGMRVVMPSPFAAQPSAISNFTSPP